MELFRQLHVPVVLSLGQLLLVGVPTVVLDTMENRRSVFPLPGTEPRPTSARV
jgi:hypothetical protein